MEVVQGQKGPQAENVTPCRIIAVARSDSGPAFSSPELPLDTSPNAGTL